MLKNNLIRIFLYGLATWAIPFVVSFFFFDRSGQVTIHEGLFKSLMIVVSAIVGGYVTISLFRNTRESFFTTAWSAGIIWLVMNWLLDIFILIPMSGMTFKEYFYTIGIRYLQIPVFTLVAGYVLSNKTKFNQ